MILSAAIEPTKGLSDKGLELVKSAKGVNEFWSGHGSGGVIYSLITLFGIGIAALILYKKGYINIEKGAQIAVKKE